MNRLEHLLTILSEECSEIIQECSKSLRFGIDDDFIGKTNLEKLTIEFNQMLAVVDMLKDEGVHIKIDQNIKSAKRDKIEEFLIYSRERGTLND